MHTGHSRTGGNDAVCFTAGPKGATFGVGVIHAWLAADRLPPEVAAGISAGALTASAMQYSYRELETGSPEADLEVRRWAWFRKYLASLSDSPLDVIWKAIPDPVDYLADKPPVADWSRPETMREEEAAARRHYYMLTKLGIWLGHVPVRFSTVAYAAITYVRYKERYGLWLWMWIMNRLILGGIGLHALFMICASPFFSERTFHLPRQRKVRSPGFIGAIRAAMEVVLRALDYVWSWRFRPLFGWHIWFGAVAAAGLLVGGTAAVLAGVAMQRSGLWKYSLTGLFLLIVAIIAAVWRKKSRDWLIAHLLKDLGIARGLLHDYALHRRLLDLFGLDPATGQEPRLDEEPFQLILVATALQAVSWKGRPLKSQQVWAENGASLTQAIRAALRVTGLFEPLRLSTNHEIDSWVDSAGHKHLDLVDGAGISQNPLPALFGWLKDPHVDRRKVAQRLCATHINDKRVHVVYNVPIEPYQPEKGQGRPERINIVKSALISRELERRRDTRQEARQTNFISQMELYVQEGGKTAGVLPIFADEIAPERDITFANNLDPTPQEMRGMAAAGCRRTLEALYRGQLRASPTRPTPCHELLTSIAPRRHGHISSETCGLPEVCAACTRQLYYRSEPEVDSPGVKPTFGLGNSQVRVADAFPHLDRQRPRIVFLGSGGVFRGSFHAGVVAAMQALRIRPDLVIGASVGALMGGALCALSVLDEKQGSMLLRDLCNTFLCVDRQVALTRTLKNVAKQLGIRARRVRLSPAELAGMVRRGGRADAGFAAVGAPPALIDAISGLFLIPHGRTRSIASEFVAGHITTAINRFFRQVERETLPSLDIENYLMGTSLLEPLARRLLGERYGIDLTNCQPYHHGSHPGSHPVSFFCTTSDFHERRSLLLGRDFLCENDFLHVPGSYDFVNAALCSSAFPIVFAPRCEAHLLPGRGRNDVLLADGGMFDNLPFFPAIEVLRDVQADYRRKYRPGKNSVENKKNALEFLADRQKQPDLIIAAALDADPDTIAPEDMDTLSAIAKRVRSLEKNVKSKSFARTSERVGELTDLLLQHPPARDDDEFIDFVDRAVATGVLQIIPTDKEHINPTFAFCRSVGMEAERVKRSIADGCFQTLRSIAAAQRGGGRFPMLETSVDALSSAGRIPPVVQAGSPRETGAHLCPFFDESRHVPEKGQATRWEPVMCPFTAAADGNRAIQEIRQVCANDKSHREIIFKASAG